MKYLFSILKPFIIILILIFSINISYGEGECDELCEIFNSLNSGETQTIVSDGEEIENYRLRIKEATIDDINQVILPVVLPFNLRMAFFLEGKDDALNGVLYDFPGIFSSDDMETLVDLTQQNLIELRTRVVSLKKNPNIVEGAIALKIASSNIDDLRPFLSIDDETIKNAIVGKIDKTSFSNENIGQLESFCSGDNMQFCLSELGKEPLSVIQEEVKLKDLMECYGDTNCRRNVEEKLGSEFSDGVIEENCEGIMNSITFCGLRKRTELNSLRRQSFEAEIREIKEANQIIPEEITFQLEGFRGTGGEVTCEADKSVAECRSKINDICNQASNNNKQKCLNSGNEQIIRNSAFKDEDAVTNANKEAIKKLAKSLNLEITCDGNVDVKACRESFETTCDKSSNKEECTTALRVLEDNELVALNKGFNFLTLLLNPDPTAMSAARFFGLEANYASNIPAFLRDPLPSTICMAKIDGFIDKTLEQNGGITKFSDDINNVEVLGDIRAQRTKVTPDNTTLITYSIYINSPLFQDPLVVPSPLNAPDLKYLGGLSYKRNGELIKEDLTGIRNITGGESESLFDTIRLPVNTTEQGVSDFQIHLVVKDMQGNTRFTLRAPVVLISAGDSYRSSVLSSRNAQENINAQESISRTEVPENFLDEFFENG